eukprot:Plantae.Rhodophyta-Palmaria_palmata.ctg1105.p1 GENE.Plantae.Rhodophyta-Palmaria_palmata.ctg1105~~Plantae.Rhodophyta-Palmaria_palmata.ctg1105.p1  ORF type:complete len:483 (-),score=123.55 Plantae.Rhodophyta-Palmaria_palmata.ctg1105:129-1391(-)
MYGDESVYIFFRLHHLMFERLTGARQMACEAADDLKLRNKCNEIGRKRVEGEPNQATLTTAPADLTRDLQDGSGPNDVPFQLNGGITDPGALFDEYFLLLQEFLAGSLDLAKYEGRCRVLLGTDSYSLSTMDKTLSKLGKQISMIFSPEAMTSAMLDIFHKSRENVTAVEADGKHQRGVEDLYTIAATSTLRKARGQSAQLFRLQHVRRPKCDDQLMIHVIGRTTTDGDDAKCAEEASAIEKFLSFSVVSGVKRSLPEAEEGDVSNGQDGSGDGKIYETADGANEPSNRSVERKSPRKRVRVVHDVKLVSQLARFAGPSDRVAKGDFYVRNEIECRIGPHRRLMFVEGKVDVLLNRKRKRKRWAMSGSDGDDFAATSSDRSSFNEKSESTHKFRRYVGRRALEGRSPGSARGEDSAAGDV